jgi:hypothetical protein
MFLPRLNRWTIIDYSCVASIGKHMPCPSLTHYTAPEWIKASLAGLVSLEAHPALDAWSLGVIGWELLTGSQAFVNLNEEEVMCKIGSF